MNIDDIDELRINKTAFKGMRNLLFLNMYTKTWDHEKEVIWRLGEGFDCLPPKLRFLRLDGYPMKCMPSNFCPTYLVKLHMQGSKLEKLWEGVHVSFWMHIKITILSNDMYLTFTIVTYRSKEYGSAEI